MKLTGRRESSNVQDMRRGSSTKKVAGGGIGVLVVGALVTWLMGGNPMEYVVQNADIKSIVLGNSDGTTSSYTPTAEEEQMATFISQVLASTEDVWTAQFQKYGKTYQVPKMVLFTGSVKSGCGNATSSVGPFYCSADQCVYLDISFFDEMKKNYGGGGDFAYAYVVAHEVGHHVQNLLGTLSAAHRQMERVSEAQSNNISVRIELQADFLAGVWAHNEHKTYGSLEDGDLEEGIRTAMAIGDDYLQKQARGYSVPESFTHGTSAMRVKWLKKGLQTGDITQGDTFSVSDSEVGL